jgi:hypothetical protein
MPTSVEEQIDKKIGEVRTEMLDMSFGELLGLHQSQELIISPDYQRLFRWSAEQQSRLVESILLELPIPQIFVVENTDGRFELIDGLQRISSIVHFVEPGLLNLESLRLSGCDIITALNGLTFSELPMRLRFRLKRAAVRVNVIKRQSSPMLRYEMFKRLNTGGAVLMPQEIRNCTARMVGDAGVRFYSFLKDSAAYASFVACTATIAETDREQKADEELVLRFFALKNSEDLFSGSVRDWLDDYMDTVMLEKVSFDYNHEKAEFVRVFDFLGRALGVGAFVRYRDDHPIGGLAPAYFEAVSVGTWRGLTEKPDITPSEAAKRIIAAVQSTSFRDCTGPGANSKQKLSGRVAIVADALRG